MHRGDRREVIVHDATDRRRFVETLAEASTKTGWLHASLDFRWKIADYKLTGGTYTSELNRRHEPSRSQNRVANPCPKAGNAIPAQGNALGKPAPQNQLALMGRTTRSSGLTQLWVRKSQGVCVFTGERGLESAGTLTRPAALKTLRLVCRAWSCGLKVCAPQDGCQGVALGWYRIAPLRRVRRIGHPVASRCFRFLALRP